jgi:hypothetical protein
MTSDDLRSFMRARSDGYWEFLATAAGETRSIVKTLDGLSRTALEDPTTSSASSLSIVEARVQALGALGGDYLTKLALTWPAPSTLHATSGDLGSDFLTVAWLSAVRFLDALAIEHRESKESMPIGLKVELETVFGAGTSVGSWDALLELVHAPCATYQQFRGVRFQPATPLSRELLVALLGSPSPATSALERLRVLTRNRVNPMPSATKFLEDLLRERWFDAPEPFFPRGGILVLMELALRNGIDPALRSSLVDELRKKISRGGGPRGWEAFAYLLADTGWQSP